LFYSGNESPVHRMLLLQGGTALQIAMLGPLDFCQDGVSALAYEKPF